MMVATLAEAAATMRGRLAGPDAIFRGVCTDTRRLRADELFVALKGPNFDGSAFVRDAATRGAAGAVVSEAVDSALSQIEVGDTLIALGDLAADWRRQMPARVVGLTGSNGKTTLKEMIASCLGRVARTLATEGNLNNEIGVPLMLLRLAPEHEFAVIEMGANHAGEIAYLTDRVAPDVVVITNAGPAHLEGFGSIEGVAKAKGEILAASPRPEFAVLNADDAYFDFWCSQADDLRIVSFGTSDGADVRVGNIAATDDGIAFDLSIHGNAKRIRLPFGGRHNALNAAAAAAVTTALGLSPDVIAEGLPATRPASGRLQALRGVNGLRIFDDSYNANPSSVRAAVEFLGGHPGEGWLVLGDMAELGEGADEFHRQVGELAKAVGVSRLFAVGAHSRHAADAFGSGATWHESVDAAIDALEGEIPGGAAVNLLVKGSRSMQMERVVRRFAASSANVAEE